MSKYLAALLLLVITSFSIHSQILDPVKWETSVEKSSDTEYTLVATATIEPGWHLYSQDVPEDGPISTTITFYTNDDFELIGNTSEDDGHTEDDPYFDMKIKYFDNKAEFKQRIRILNKEPSLVKGEVEYMACNDTQCTPPTIKDLVFNLNNGATSNTGKVDATADSEIDKIENGTTTGTTTKTSKEESQKGLWTIFFIAFLSGFAALLTPCVFPMIPMTVSFFTKQSKTRAAGIRNAIVYGISIIVIYVVLGLLVTWIFGPSALNALATNVWFNLIFFLLLVIFAVSFLGAFEITLPSSWGTKIDNQADRGGMIGIFFMALALAIVSFSCTGPIVGTLLVEAASKGGLAPVIGMLGFSLAIALPFALFAAFPGWLNSLPKSGGWLNTVKVVLGFLELALAFKFLSQADLVLQLHWLEREVFLAIWIAIFGTMALYLFGKIKLPHDSPLTHISVGRLSLGLLTLAFTIYMIPGLWGAPLNLISAFPPPQHYSESPYGVGNSGMGVTVQNHQNGGGHDHDHDHTDEDCFIPGLPDGAHMLPPHNIIVFHDFEIGLAYAKEVNKPVMLDFTGWACVNCRKMEQNVWPKPEILNKLKNEVVLISLYVDDKRPLPEGEEVESKLRPGKQLKYIGQKWSEFQTIRYKANTQPFYVLIDHNEENLNDPVGYTPNADEYLKWLEDGIGKFKKD
ncbi:cytochrome c biogenesis protein CcdA [Aureibaculum sp. 2210JD6-5]|uniref:protein-disulfide reductase DsbD family protein n=1 Tax=Aureibaculum sp. 2210JD6-5 TaxID=3103957 RepID=UPI002AAEA7F7|nr:cytochrome c biogenesis protein CcdA [Aureibaculum sp. 2210JD6-5]MDY7396948.1 cytochrome c biogenesis protein CcdA [Aureibaculum sp. 2210JD6-5]